MLYFNILCYIALFFQRVYGDSDSNSSCIYTDNPFQRTLSLLECFKYEQPGCNGSIFDMDEFKECHTTCNGTLNAATRFYLFPHGNDGTDPELMHKCGGQPPKDTKFDPKCKTLVMFPGFVSGACHTSIYRELIIERMKCGCYNYIHVEWTWGNSFDLETSVRQNQPIVACQVAKVIKKLIKRYNLTGDDFICAGHSLGCHGCGLVGQYLKYNYGITLGKITGVDPAGVVYWESMDKDLRLSPDDAKCVEVIHCNAGQCLPNYWGVNFTCGTRDFYMNDGLHQMPGCYKQMFISFLRGDFLYALVSLLFPGCNHLHCLQYYKASMCPCNETFVGVECNGIKDCMNTRKNRDCEDASKCAVPMTDPDECENCVPGNKTYHVKASSSCPFIDNSGIRNLDKFTCYADMIKNGKYCGKQCIRTNNLQITG